MSRREPDPVTAAYAALVTVAHPDLDPAAARVLGYLYATGAEGVCDPETGEAWLLGRGDR